MPLAPRWVSLALCLQTISVAAAGLGEAPKLSVLFFLVDDGGFEIGTFGNNVTNTPNIDGLAARAGATVYDRAYTAVSSCSPSRSAILTGLPTHQNGMYGLHQYPGNFQSNTNVHSLPNLLNKAGYQTGIIGKYHVGPVTVYNFSQGLGSHGPADCWAGAAPCASDYNLVTRNITFMKENAGRFFSSLGPDEPFFLYVGFGDCHRCPAKANSGPFCEKYGSGGPHGVIPDWKPKFFSPKEVVVPPFLPDNELVRRDIASQYTAVERMDQGVGLILKELETAGREKDTLIIFFSDNGIPFPSGKTNLFTNQGQGEPLIVVNPMSRAPSTRSTQTVSSLDFAPTILDAAGVHYPKGARAGNHPARLLGTSLILDRTGGAAHPAFASHQFHSLYAYYPMRSITHNNWRCVLNLNYDLQFAILEDVYDTATWQDLMKKGEAGEPTGWVYDYKRYMQRPQWELYNVEKDPLSLTNLANDPGSASVLLELQTRLARWREDSHDPWLPCSNSSTTHVCSI
jgi:N-sulfoglucosamine sulfohydrolase